MMTILSWHIVVCLDSIKSDFDWQNVINEITLPELNPAGVHSILEISHNEAENMCANMFDVLDQDGNHCVIMSKRAEEAFSEENLQILKSYKIVVSDVGIIEEIGGGSCWCMLVEAF